MNWKRTVRWSWLILPFLLLAVWPSVAAAKDELKPCVTVASGQACLYEVTEEAVFLDGFLNPVDPTTTRPTFRSATAAIMGTTGASSAVCPKSLPCSVVGVGSSFICLVPTGCTLGPNIFEFGKGTFKGEFATVVNEPGTVDAPEVVTAAGKFAGLIDLSRAVLSELGLGGGAPLGSLSGQWCLGPGCTPSRRLSGTFRLPFTSAGVLKKLVKHHFMLPNGGVRPAFYLVDEIRVPVRDVERSLGAPTVRLEAVFE